MLHHWSVLCKKLTNGPQIKKTLFSGLYNLLFVIIANLAKHLSCYSMSLLMPGAYHTVYFFSNSLSLWGSLLVLIHLSLYLCIHQFTVDFVITFYVPYTANIFVWISQSKTFSIIKNQITLCCSSSSTAVSVAAIVTFLVTT